MKGLIVADVNIIKMHDNTLESGSSKYVPAAITTKQNINKKWTSGVSKEEFKVLQDYIFKRIKEISKEILEGNIDIKPYKKNQKTQCKYCTYHSICGFNSKYENACYRYIDNKSSDDILKLMKLEKGD